MDTFTFTKKGLGTEVLTLAGFINGSSLSDVLLLLPLYYQASTALLHLRYQSVINLR